MTNDDDAIRLLVKRRLDMRLARFAAVSPVGQRVKRAAHYKGRSATFHFTRFEMSPTPAFKCSCARLTKSSAIGPDRPRLVVEHIKEDEAIFHF